MPGHAVVYLHGLPGGPAEPGLFGPAPAWASRALIPDRAADRPDLGAAAYFDDLARRAADHAGGAGLHLIGFSLGARAALEIAHRLGPRVARLDLVSPAGPLDGSDHLDLMAGRRIFAMAAARPGLFAAQTAVQGWIARRRPGLLYRALFGAAGEAGLQDPAFAPRATAMLGRAFPPGAPGYRREILAYVAPWADLPGRVAEPATLWSGDGDLWTPPAMAARLCALLPRARLHPVPGRGHYGALRAALAAIAP